MRVAILGATKGMGRSLARAMAARGDRLALLGRDAEQLERSAADLQARAGSDEPVITAICDLADPSSFGPALDAAAAGLGKLDCVVVTAGLFATQDQLEADPELALRLVTLDFANTVGFCERARVKLLAGGGGKLCVFSSVAGDRGRKPVVIYGAAKAGLSAYLEGLDHKFRAQGLQTICVKPGFVKTGMTANLKPPPFAGEPDAVAARVLRAIDRGTPVVYAPWIWRFVMLAIRWLPRFVMRRIGF
ncbi:Oxidoreductase, short-chain dehydrogenase/reductase family protein [Enhygromyxa salina]|uniref:Oxidoreductase, short-chain dehydrogenase/reductase family protein n=1 Tax=Enhygromyxa salina TaxID=215803 RepID=A0A0C1Z6V6_9BACT|nr:SDR family NAD(P)-dependent oxidoreductase [Enhygromyxa salina]KIG13364.1 Oxidoreductase, short-chain dehydrogenase/reductase family protein [Enhygromyxa salina]